MQDWDGRTLTFVPLPRLCLVRPNRSYRIDERIGHGSFSTVFAAGLILVTIPLTCLLILGLQALGWRTGLLKMTPKAQRMRVVFKDKAWNFLYRREDPNPGPLRALSKPSPFEPLRRRSS